MSSADGSTVAKPGFRSALTHRDFRLLVASLATSGIGDWFYNVALVVFVLESTDSPAWVAAASIGRLLPYVLFSALGGAIADRYDRRLVMVVADLVRAALMLLLAAVAIASLPVGLAILIAFLSTAAGTPFFPAVAALTPRVVDERSLAPANALMTTIDSLSIAVGPALGGLVLLLGPPEIAFAVNALTFLVSAVFLARLQKHAVAPEPSATEEEPPLRRRLADASRVIASSRAIAVLFGLIFAAALTYGQESVLYPLVAEDLLDIGARGVGFLWASVGAGGVLMAGLTNRAAGRPRTAMVFTLGSLVSAAPLLLLPFTTLPALAYVLLAVEGGSFILVEVLSTTVLQRTVPEKMIGSVFGILDTVSVAGTVLGALLAPLIVDLGGVRTALWAAGGILAVATLACFPVLRAIDRGSEQRRRELEPRVATLEHLDIFAGMPRPALERLASSLTETSASLGETVLREGDEADDFFIVVSGELEVTARGEAAQTRTVNRLGTRDYFGEIGLIERIPRTATVTATTPCRLLRVPGEAFLQAVEQSPRTGTLFAGVAARLAATHPSYRPTQERRHEQAT